MCAISTSRVRIFSLVVRDERESGPSLLDSLLYVTFGSSVFYFDFHQNLIKLA